MSLSYYILFPVRSFLYKKTYLRWTINLYFDEPIAGCGSVVVFSTALSWYLGGGAARGDADGCLVGVHRPGSDLCTLPV